MRPTIRALALAAFSALLLGLFTFVPSTAQATANAPTSSQVVAKKHPKKKANKNKRAKKGKKKSVSVTWPIGPGRSGPTVKDIQSRLKLRDLYAGKTTGFYNPATQQAVLAFQTNQGLPATGLTDRVTYQKLS